MVRCDKAGEDVARCDKILRRLGTKFKSVTEIKSLSKMGMKALQDVRSFH